MYVDKLGKDAHIVNEEENRLLEQQIHDKGHTPIQDDKILEHVRNNAKNTVSREDITDEQMDDAAALVQALGFEQVVPRNMDEVRALLSGRDPRFREPMTQREERDYLRVWSKRTGEGKKGVTKPKYNKHEKARKLRQASQSRQRAQKRLNNNRKREDKV
jgi:hypothetical protein